MGLSSQRRTKVLIGLALFVALSVLSVTPAAAAGLGTLSDIGPLLLTPGPLWGTYGLEAPLVKGAGDQGWASISGDYVAYEDNAGPDSDVKLYNRKTNAVTNIAAIAGSNQWRPRIWGNRVVWMDNRNGNWDIWWHDIAKKQTTRLTTLASEQSWPEISGDRVVWQDNRNGNFDIYMYDFKSKATTRITTNTSSQEHPRINGNRIVWNDHRNGNWDIYWYDLAAKREYQMPSLILDEYDADVWGDRAAWTVNNGGNLECALIFYFDRYGAVGGYITGPGNQDRPRLYKDTFVYTDTASGTALTRMHRFGSTSWLEPTTSAGSKWEPQFWEDTLVWHDQRAGNDDVYAMRIPSPKLTASAAAPAYGSGAKVTGQLKAWNGTPLANRMVQVQYLRHSIRLTNAQTTWPIVDTDGGTPGTQYAKTDANGKFTATVPVQAERYYLRTHFNGDPDAFMQTSARQTVRSKVSLSKPVGKKRVSNTKSYTYYGYLKPKHAAGGSFVKIKCYRKSGGKWRLKKTYTTTLSDYNATTSKYKKKVKLSTEGKWRIKAVYAETFNYAETSSSYKYVTSY